MKKLQRSKLLSQNFLHDSQLVKDLVNRMSIGSNETVIEIGPGKGIITSELLTRARQVIAVELDYCLIPKLLSSIVSPKLTLFQADFLDFPLPATDYLVVSNTPFAIEGKIIRKLLHAHNQPTGMYLVVRADVAKRWAGMRKEGAFSISHKPWFEFEITHHFKATDFQPVPNVDSVLLTVLKRQRPLLDRKHQQDFSSFVSTVFGSGRTLSSGLKNVCSKKRMQQISQRTGISLKAKPAALSVDDWVKAYCYVKSV